MLFRDQLHRTIEIESYPQRLISLVPSITELLFDLDLGDKVVGLTKFCIHPKGFKKKKTIIGGTKNFKLDQIDALKPELIIGNKEENYQEGIASLAEKYPVWISDVKNFEDAYAMIKGIGKITNKLGEAENLVEKIRSGFNQEFSQKGTAIYLIWNDPIMVAGKDTFIDHMLHVAGYQNLITASRYPEVLMKKLIDLNPNYLLLSSEPFPFKEKHLHEYKKLIPKAKVQLVDGELFSWYGSRLLLSPPYFQSLNR